MFAYSSTYSNGFYSAHVQNNVLVSQWPYPLQHTIVAILTNVEQYITVRKVFWKKKYPWKDRLSMG